VTGLEHLYSCGDLRSQGFRVRLDAYRLHVFLDFRDVVEDEEHPYGRLASQLGAGGVRSVDDALGQMVMAEVIEPVRRLLSMQLMGRLAGPSTLAEAADELRTIWSAEIEGLFSAAAEIAEDARDPSAVESAVLTDVEALLGIAAHAQPEPEADEEGSAIARDGAVVPPPDGSGWATALLWILVRRLGELSKEQQPRPAAAARFEEWHLRSALIDLLLESGATEGASRRAALVLELLLVCDSRAEVPEGEEPGLADFFEELFNSDAGQQFLGVHLFDEASWFNREAFEELAGWLALRASVDAVAGADSDARERVLEISGEYQHLVDAAKDAGYRFVDFLGAIRADDFRESAD
jgi:hypothetical protein